MCLIIIWSIFICKFNINQKCYVHITLPHCTISFAICKWWSNLLQTMTFLGRSSRLPSCPTNMPMHEGGRTMSNDNASIATAVVLMHWVCNLYQEYVHDVLVVKSKTSCILKRLKGIGTTIHITFDNNLCGGMIAKRTHLNIYVRNKSTEPLTCLTSSYIQHLHT